MKKILLPVDGSNHAAKAAGFAGDLAEKYGAEVVLLHVIDRDRLSEAEEHMAEVEHIARRGRDTIPWVANVPAELAAMLQPPEPRRTQEQMLGYLAEKVIRAATDIVEEHGVPHERIRILFKNGDAVKRILQTVRDEDVDTVVMGSRGLSDIAGLALGSVSHRVAHGAGCTVVTVR